ncbi:hypothetical protein D4R86_00305 [bacterium]|nr:MAG: hypothetical protein D4R86_00305 [bacterium]
MKINYTELLKQYNGLNNLCTHIDLLAAIALGRPYGHGEFKGMETEGARFEDVYNTECHCHPVYKTDIYYIKPEWINACEYDEEYGDYFDTELIKLLEVERARIEKNKLDKEREVKKAMAEQKRIWKEATEKRDFMVFVEKWDGNH